MTKEDLKKELERVEKEISSIKYIEDNPEYYNELYSQKIKLIEEYNVVSKPLIAQSDELDIYLERVGRLGNIYNLTLHNDTNLIGYIRISFDGGESMYGNIGYEIRPSYRGNNFAFKALELLEETMINNGLTKPMITAFPNNLGSIRIIEKFGGELIKGIEQGYNYNRYQVDLIKKKEQSIKQMKKRL
jgi:predicted acetyltransferase